MPKTSDAKSIKGKIELHGGFTAFEETEGCGPNAYAIRHEGYRLIRGSMPREIRAELMRAVKNGKLGRLPKEKFMAEAFFHPNSKVAAMEAREREKHEAIKVLTKICVPHSIYD